MVLSQKIALILEEMLEEAGGELSIARNELAGRLGCVPSQINYVITSRFTPQRGYVVESRRGGGGYVRIRKVSMKKDAFLLHMYGSISERVDSESARVYFAELVRREILTPREARLLLAQMSQTALSAVEKEGRALLRADLMKHTLLQILSETEEI